MTSFAGPFVDMFEALRMAPVFARGRRDVRAGHVRSLTISSSLVVALVRAPEEPAAHRARIAVRAFGAAEWARIEDELAAQAGYAAALLAGRMPAGIDRVFAAGGLHLLPLGIDEIAMDCSCESWPMPCTHVAATVYALARSFDADPFGAFAWRGRPRDELLDRLHQLRGAAAVTAAGHERDDVGTGLGDLAGFWGEFPKASSGVPAGVGASSAVPGAVRPDALLDQLDLPPPIVRALRPAYQALP